MECKTKGWWNGPKHISLLLWLICGYKSANLNKLNMLPWFCIPTMSRHFQSLSKFVICHWISLRLDKVSRIEKLLTFSFITTTFLDVLDKKRYQHNKSQYTYLSIDHWGRLSWRMSTYDNLANSRLSQRNSSSKLFWLKNLWVDNIQLPAYHTKLTKTNKK